MRGRSDTPNSQGQRPKRMDPDAALIDSKQMLNRSSHVLLARMPSMRPSAFNARTGAAKKTSSATPGAAVVQPASDGDEDAAKAGGFHESSYELRNGLEIRESEWPLDITVPGALGDV